MTERRPADDLLRTASGRPRQRPGTLLGRKPHHWMRHKGYSTLRRMAKGTLSARSREWQAIQAAAFALAADLGGWEQLSAQQKALVEMAAVKSVVCAMMAAYALSRGSVVGAGGQLRAPLSSHWLSWSAELRRDLLALGLTRSERIIDLAAEVTRLTAPESGAPDSGAQARESEEGS